MNTLTPTIDMNNIANLFFAVALMQTAFAHVVDGDKIVVFFDEKVIETDYGLVSQDAGDQAQMSSTGLFKTGRYVDAEIFADEVMRLANIMQDLNDYNFGSPNFEVTVNIGRYQPIESRQPTTDDCGVQFEDLTVETCEGYVKVHHPVSDMAFLAQIYEVRDDFGDEIETWFNVKTKSGDNVGVAKYDDEYEYLLLCITDYLEGLESMPLPLNPDLL